MIATTIRNTDTTNNAGFPPAPPEAHQRAATLRPAQICEHYAFSLAETNADPGNEYKELGLHIALLQAEFVGYDAWKASVTTVPAAFADVPRLVQAWQYGQDRAAHDSLNVA